METKAYLFPLAGFREKYPQLSKRQLERLAGDYAVKTVVSRLLKRPYEEVAICREGKPYLTECNLQFNLSHSGEYLLLAVGEVPLGVDIENITKIRPKVTKKYFSDSEQDQVAKEGENAFFEIWTKKESYVKYTGEGIKGLGTSTVFPQTVGFYSKTFMGHQLSVCCDSKHLPQKINIWNEPIPGNLI